VPWALAVLDTLPVVEVNRLVATIRPDARWWRVWDDALDALKRRDGLSAYNRWQRALIAFHHGTLAESFARMEEPRTSPFLRTCWFTLRHLDGLPVGDERLTSAASFAAVDTGSAWALSCGAMYAAQEGRWDDHRQLLERLDARAERLLADGNTSGARFNAAQANVARSVGEWKHGRTAAGFELLEEARRGGVHWPGISGDLLMDMGDYRAAVRQYNTDWTGPLTRLKLARAHEMLGEDEKARAAYSYFVQAWSDADPELQPIVEQAKESIARLNADRPL
jgi:hypothetical protein